MKRKMKIQSIANFLRMKSFGFKILFKYHNSDMWHISTKSGLKLAEQYSANTIVDLANKKVIKSSSSNFDFWSQFESIEKVAWYSLA